MKATWNSLAHRKIVYLLWASMAVGLLISTVIFNNNIDSPLPIYLSMICSIGLFLISFMSDSSKHASVSIDENGELLFRDDAKKYQVTISKDDIKRIRLRKYPLLKSMIIDTNSNQRLTMHNVSIPEGFPIASKLKI